jgi:DNA-binding NarL/FixJ family response regulator
VDTTRRVAHTPLAVREADASLAKMTRVEVLTVHHEEAIRRALRAVVTATEGFDGVGEAASAEEALELAVALRPSLALVGTGMPGIDGFETCQRLLASVPEIAVVLLYDSTEPSTALIARSGAAAATLTDALTPVSLQALWGKRRDR